MGAYENNLRHVAEPASPSERRKAVSVDVQDHTALWYTDVLREYAHYGDHEVEGQGSIAVAYASYIDKKVRDEGSSHVTLYAHTNLAAETLLDALYHHRTEGELKFIPFDSAEEAAAAVVREHVDE